MGCISVWLVVVGTIAFEEVIAAAVAPAVAAVRWGYRIGQMKWKTMFLWIVRVWEKKGKWMWLLMQEWVWLQRVMLCAVRATFVDRFPVVG